MYITENNNIFFDKQKVHWKTWQIVHQVGGGKGGRTQPKFECKNKTKQEHQLKPYDNKAQIALNHNCQQASDRGQHPNTMFWPTKHRVIKGKERSTSADGASTQNTDIRPIHMQIATNYGGDHNSRLRQNDTKLGSQISATSIRNEQTQHLK